MLRTKDEADTFAGELYDLDIIDYDTYQDILEKIAKNTELED